MSEEHGHVVSTKAYYAVFAFLMVMTAATVVVAKIDLGIFNTLVALAIAVSKATAVILIFMHVKWANKLARLFVLGGFFWLLLMFVLVMMDYAARSTLGYR
ncbi:MAG: cytochrome C oxidase subunit IV family protein [Bryobacteraceae bacterium]